MKDFRPPNYPDVTGLKSVFLAGSIEMGKASHWQSTFTSDLGKALREAKVDEYKWVVLNPRREHWDNTWDQDIRNPHFYQQVEWELSYLERCKHRIFYFEKDTISPISLLELGRFGGKENNYVVVDREYARKGNVDIFCHRYQIPRFETLHQAMKQMLDNEYLYKKRPPQQGGDLSDILVKS